MKGVNSGIAIGLAGLVISSLSACAAEKSESASTRSAASTSTKSTSASVSTTTVTVTPSTTTSTATTSTSTTTSTSATSPMVGGMTECTKSALAEPAAQAAQALGASNVYTVDQLSCANGWAVTSGLLASKENPQMGAPTSFIFEQEGQFWVPKDKSQVCGTNPTTTVAPSDALIPAALFVAGCAAG